MKMKTKCPNCGGVAKEKNNYMVGEYSLRCDCGLVIQEGKYRTMSNWDAENQKLLDEVIEIDD